MRESYRSVFRRLVLAVALGSAEFTLIMSLFIDGQPFATEILVAAAVIGFVLASLVRYLISAFDLLGFNKSNVLVLGAGERASIIERRMRRKVDRHGFNLFGFRHHRT